MLPRGDLQPDAIQAHRPELDLGAEFERMSLRPLQQLDVRVYYLFDRSLPQVFRLMVAMR